MVEHHILDNLRAIRIEGSDELLQRILTTEVTVVVHPIDGQIAHALTTGSTRIGQPYQIKVF